MQFHVLFGSLLLADSELEEEVSYEGFTFTQVK